MNAANPGTPTLAAVDEVFREQRATGAAPSAVWGVFDRSGLIHSGADGELPGGRTPAEHTAYRIASCTKSFTAAAVLALRDEGALHLDEPVTRFVPAFSQVRLPGADAATPTVRMLLTMSAGFPTDDPWADRQEAMTTGELEALLAHGVSFDSTPGTRFAYSNLGFALLGRVVDVSAGRGYREVVRERFLEPLGLGGTAFEASAYAADAPAVGARRIDDEWEYLPFSGPGAFSPIGGLFSTVADLSRWAAWLAEAFDGTGADTAGTPLSRASRRELQQSYRFVPGRGEHPTGYGFGLFVEEYEGIGPVVSHSGGYPGFSAHMRWLPGSGLGIVAFENATFSRVALPTTAAFDALIAGQATDATARVWPQTRAAQAAVTALVRSWSDAAAAELFTENVDQDMPLGHRRAAIEKAIDEVGGLAEEPVVDVESAAPSHLVWLMPGRSGRLRVELKLNPESPPRVQLLGVTVDREVVGESRG